MEIENLKRILEVQKKGRNQTFETTLLPLLETELRIWLLQWKTSEEIIKKLQPLQPIKLSKTQALILTR